MIINYVLEEIIKKIWDNACCHIFRSHINSCEFTWEEACNQKIMSKIHKRKKPLGPTGSCCWSSASWSGSRSRPSAPQTWWAARRSGRWGPADSAAAWWGSRPCTSGQVRESRRNLDHLRKRLVQLWPLCGQLASTLFFFFCKKKVQNVASQDISEGQTGFVAEVGVSQQLLQQWLPDWLLGV